MYKQKGFSAVVLLLGLLLIVAVGFTGYYVWNTQNNNKDNSKEVAPAAATKQESNQETPAPVKEEQKYLVIKEWGVKIPVDDNYTYKYSIYDSNGFTYMRLTADEITKEAPGCDVFSLSRYQEKLGTDGASPPALLSENKINGYYYYGQPSQGLCADDTTMSQAAISNQTKLQPIIRELFINNSYKIVAI
jgi:hypothetical protein